MASAYSAAANTEISGAAITKRVKNLLRHFDKDDLRELRQTGSSGDFDARAKFLMDISSVRAAA